MIRTAPVFTLTLLILAGCARSEDAMQVQPDTNQGYNRVGQVRSPEADDSEPAIGEWRGSIQEERQALEFGPLGTEPLFSLLCSPSQVGAVLLQRHGGAPTGQAPIMQVATGSVVEELLGAPGGGAIPMLRAEVAVGSRMIAALAGPPQAITLRLADGTPLVMPPSPLVGDYVRGCANPQAGAPTTNIATTAPAANAAVPAPAPTGNGAAPRP